MEGGIQTHQDGAQFEDALRRLHALEKKLTGQVQEDITELREQWVQPRVDRVTNNTFKLYQVRENLKQSKMLYVEEEQLLGEFSKVKQALIINSMDEEMFEAAKETCLVLGGKLTDVRNRQLMCYSDSKDLETAINKDIMTLQFESKDFQEVDLNHVRCTTPLRQLSPTPLEKHRSREPSPFKMPAMKISTGTTTPSGTIPTDPHAYFSRPGSSQSMYGGRGGDSEVDAFRAAMEAKQAEDDSPPKNRKQPSQYPTTISKSTSGNIVVRSASGIIIGKSDGSEAGTTGPLFTSERPSSAMSDMSINIHETGHVTRPDSRLELLGDDVSGLVDPYAPLPDHIASYVDDQDTELNLESEEELKRKEQAEIEKRAAEQMALIQKEAQEKVKEKEKLRLAEEASARKAEEEMKKEKQRLERELEMKEREERRLADEKKMKDMAEKRQKEAELKKEKEAKAQEELKQKKVEEKQEKIRKAEEAKLKKEEEERKKEELKKAKAEEKKQKIEAAKEKKRLEEENRNKEKEASKLADNKSPLVKTTEPASIVTGNNNSVIVTEEIEISTADAVKLPPTETPKLNKPKRKPSASKPEEDKKEETKPALEVPADSPVSILKGGKSSRDPSKDRKSSRDTSRDRKTSRDASKDKSGSEDVTADDKPLSRKGSLKKSSSFTKRGLLAEKKKISFDEDVDVEKFETEKDVNINTAKEIFAAIADTSLEAGTNILKHRSRDPSRERQDSKGSGSGFPQAEPAEWFPPEGSECDNEDELMIILDTDPQQQQFESKNLLSVRSAKSRSESKERPGSRGSQVSSSSAVSKPDLEVVDSVASTGFTHLDEFERKLAEMSQDLEKEQSFKEVATDFKETYELKDEPIYATITPKKERLGENSHQLTDDGFFINKEEDLLSYDRSYVTEAEEEVGSEYSRNKKVSFAESDERFEFERQKKDSGLRSFTKFFSLAPPKPLKSLPGKEITQEPVEITAKPTETLDIPPTVPRRSRSKDPSPCVVNENANPKAFLSAMTGGLLDANKTETGSVFGSLLRGRRTSRSGSRQSSRQSSGDRSSQDLWSDEDGRPSSRGSVDPYDGTSDVLSDTSLVNKLKKFKKRKPRKVQPADFDELFARGMAISAQKESENNQFPTASRRSRKRQTQETQNGALSITVTSPSEGNNMIDENGTRFTPFEVYSQDKAFQTAQKDAGIGYAEKVMSYLDDVAQTPVRDMVNGDSDGAHVSRGRKKHHKKPTKESVVDGSARSKSTEERKRSREYTKPEDVKLSPAPIRDLYTGELLSGQPSSYIREQNGDTSLTRKEIQLGQQESKSVTTDPHTYRQNGVSPRPYNYHTQGMAPSPGKSFLDAVTGQEVFGASIEGENPQISVTDTVVPSNEMNSSLLTTTAMNTNYDPSAMISPQPAKPQPIQQPRREEPADKGIPDQLVPDKLLANEEFYEQLRSGIKGIEAPEMPFEHTQEDPESYHKYSHHLGRAEFGTLKKRPSAATSRDPSGDRLNQHRSQNIGLSRDPSGDRLALSSKISRQSSKEQMRSDSRFSNYSGGLPDLETDDTAVLAAAQDSEGGVQRTVSLLVSGVDMDRPADNEGQRDMKTRREEVLKEIAQHKQEIREAKGWIQNGLMTVVGFGVMVYLQTLESAGM